MTKNKFFLTILGLILLISVTQASVVANFTASSVYSATYPATINFTDSSICSPACTGWAYDFNNDGSIESIGQNPSYIYTYPGNYSVKLIVSNDENTGSKLRLYYITIGPAYVPTPIPSPTGTWGPTYHGNNGTSFQYQLNNNVDLPNSTFLKYWLQNYTTTKQFSVFAFASGIMAPLVHVFGFWIFILLWALVLFAIWIRSQDITLPAVVGILTIGAFGMLFPDEAFPVMIAIIVTAIAIVITKMMKENI
jgi:hypothetical protein